MGEPYLTYYLIHLKSECLHPFRPLLQKYHRLGTLNNNYCSHTVQRVGESPWGPFYEGTNLMQKDSSLLTCSHPKGPTSSYRRFRFQYTKFVRIKIFNPYYANISKFIINKVLCAEWTELALRCWGIQRRIEETFQFVHYESMFELEVWGTKAEQSFRFGMYLKWLGPRGGH